MKRTLFLTAVLTYCTSTVMAATYTDLTNSWCDDVNNVIYDGQGHFIVESASSTSVDLTISLDSLLSYVNSNDYKSGNYMLLWDDNAADYGLSDNADTSLDTGSRTPYLTGYWNNASWTTTNNISYSTLSEYATDGYVTLNITNSSTNGVKVTATDKNGESGTLYDASTLKAGANTVTNGYYVNLNYVTAVTLNTVSTLDTDSYVPPVDYSQPFVSQRTDGTTVGRITFLGDSITHGVNDQSYRWQFFKTLTDNGIENEIVGPREGYHNSPGHTEDAGSNYGGAEFANVHLAQASGRTHNIISGSTSYTVNGTPYSSGVNYGGHSTTSTAEAYDSNTWFCMMGTNDLLSDTTNSGPSTADYVKQMQKMLGGTVSYNAYDDTYTWQAGSTWGTMAEIVDDVCQDGDTFYMLSITPWGNHSNHNRDMDHYAAEEFNRNLDAWTQAYSQETGKNVVYVDVTRGMVDKTSTNRFMGYDGFFNNSGDRLHPNDQGSIIMAGNLSQAMGIGGRTAGLERQGTAGWSNVTVGTVSNGTELLFGENAFTMTDGYTVDLSANFGNGATDGWLDASNTLSIALGDGTNSGTLNLSEGYIMWGNDILFCWDNSTLASEGNLRIAWHNGNATDNVLQGYYVWLDDMLIGQGLSATTGEGLNGILLSANGANGTVNTLSWTNTAYAPTTLGKYSAENAYITVQDSAAVSTLVTNTAYVTSGVDFSSATTVSAKDGQILVTNDTTAATNGTTKITAGAGWTGLTNCSHKGDINAQVTGTTTYTVFGAMNNASAGKLTLEVVDGASVGNGTYSGHTAAIAGSFGNGSAESFNVYVNGGTVQGDIVGGAVNGTGSIDTVKLVINGGKVEGQVMGGSKTNGTVGSATIIVKDGEITGGINAGGSAGSVGHASVAISGGTIKGNITKGNATTSHVAVIGSQATIEGSIEADRVSFIEADYKLTLSNVNEIELTERSQIRAVMGEQAALDSLTLGNGTTFTAWKNGTAAQAVTDQETVLRLQTLSVGKGATLNANVEFTADSSLSLGGTLTMGSELALTSGMSLSLSNELLERLFGGEEISLFTGVDALSIDGKDIAAGTYMDATGIFTGLSDEYTYYMSYDGSSVNLSIPEPTTATLSLLALAALAARRRRK